MTIKKKIYYLLLFTLFIYILCQHKFNSSAYDDKKFKGGIQVGYCNLGGGNHKWLDTMDGIFKGTDDAPTSEYDGHWYFLDNYWSNSDFTSGFEYYSITTVTNINVDCSLKFEIVDCDSFKVVKEFYVDKGNYYSFPITGTYDFFEFNHYLLHVSKTDPNASGQYRIHMDSHKDFGRDPNLSYRISKAQSVNAYMAGKQDIDYYSYLNNRYLGEKKQLLNVITVKNIDCGTLKVELLDYPDDYNNVEFIDSILVAPGQERKVQTTSVLFNIRVTTTEDVCGNYVISSSEKTDIIRKKMMWVSKV